MRNGHKYGAKPTVVDNIRFASKAEAKRYGELKVLERAGEIRELELQPRYDLSAWGQKIARYIADFRYKDRRDNFRNWVVEDVKGVKTPVYQLKKKLMAVQYGITITEITR